MVKARIVVTAAVTWLVFTTEAFIHYSMGKGKWEWPDWKESLKIIGLVFVFSLLSAGVAQFIIQVTLPPAKKGKVIQKAEDKFDKITKN